MDEYESLVKWFDENGYRLRFRHYRKYLADELEGFVDYSGKGIIRYAENKVTSWVARRYYRRAKNDFEPYAKGGETEVEVERLDAVSGEYESFVIGWTECKDMENYCYKTGRLYAMKDAYHTITGEEYAIE